MNAKAAAAEVLPPLVAPQVLTPQVPMIPTTEADRLIVMAIEKNLPIEQLEKLLAMRKELRAEAAASAFLDAMARFQAECPVIRKNRTAKIKSKSTGVEFSYKYAELGAIVKVAAPLIGKNGLSYTIRCVLTKDPAPAQVATVYVRHVLGHSEESSFQASIDLNAVVNDMQKAASAATFAKRQAFSNAFGILTIDEDDDGRAGGARDAGGAPEGAERQESRVAAPRAKPEEKDDGTPATASQIKLVKAKLENAGLSTADMKKRFGFDPAGMTKAKVNPVLEWIRNPAPAGA